MGLKIIIPKGLGFLLVHLYDFFVYMKDEWDSTKKNLQIFSILLNKSPKQHGHGNILEIFKENLYILRKKVMNSSIFLKDFNKFLAFFF